MDELTKLIKKLNNEMKSDVPFLKGSLYHSKVSCGYESCKKCKSGQFHPVVKFTYTDKIGKRTSTTIPKKYFSQVKITWGKYKKFLQLERKLKKEIRKYLKTVRLFKRKKMKDVKSYMNDLKKGEKN